MRCLESRSAQPGFVLLLTLVFLGVASWVIGDMAERYGRMRDAAAATRAQAQARLAVSDALALATFWFATKPLAPAGYGTPGGMVVADGRFYNTPSGAVISFQDIRGLLSVNIPARLPWMQRLVDEGLQPVVADAWLDVLLDYTDADHLKRLNGAEAAQYQELGLSGPRNDWFRAQAEVRALPLWRDEPERVNRILRHASLERRSWINPNTAPREVLQAYFPGSQQGIDRLLRWRKSAPLLRSAEAQSVTGLAFDSETFLFFASPDARITLWAPGLPRALQYTVSLMPGGEEGPWLITERTNAPQPDAVHDLQEIARFPLDVAVDEVSRPVVARRP